MKMGIVAVGRLDFIRNYMNYDILLWDTQRPGPALKGSLLRFL